MAEPVVGGGIVLPYQGSYGPPQVAVVPARRCAVRNQGHPPDISGGGQPTYPDATTNTTPAHDGW